MWGETERDSVEVLEVLAEAHLSRCLGARQVAVAGRRISDNTNLDTPCAACHGLAINSGGTSTGNSWSRTRLIGQKFRRRATA